jgi:hypothetical protein
MRNIKARLLISDPWEFGEEVEWPSLSGILEESSLPDGRSKYRFVLDKPLHYRELGYDSFDISPRYVGVSMEDIMHSEVTCSCISGNIDRKLHFVGSLLKTTED